MEIAKKLGCVILVMGVAGLFLAGCGEQVDSSSGAALTAVKLCEGCGHVKGSDQCCAPGAQKCGCGMAKGSPGCCKHFDFSKGDVALCTKCGQVKGTESCCVAEATQCSKCGLAKGSPGCCKI